MSLQEIKVSREEVLKIVNQNKEKHDQILKDAIEGYWMEAEAYLKKNEKIELDAIAKEHRQELKELRKERKEAIKTLRENTKADLEKVKLRDKSKGFNYWIKKYPEDHGDDYIGTIRRLELCVDNELELNSNEFDSYIRNKWTWKDAFISSNTGYVSAYNANYVCTSSCATIGKQSLYTTAISGSSLNLLKSF